MHEPTFRKAASDGGLNPYLLQMANIREHCSWVTIDPAAATAKAKRILSAQIHRLPLNESLDPIEVPVNHDVLVVGGGIAGIEAALKLSATGKHVTLVERNPSIGGHMAMFDKTFPTLDCAACILTPKMSALGKDPTSPSWPTPRSSTSRATSATSRSRSARRRATSTPTPARAAAPARKPAWCARSASEFDQGLGFRSAIYIPFAQAVPLRATIDPTKCLTLSKGKCKQQSCVPACGPGAIDFEQKDEVVEIDVGAIIMATGFELWDATQESRYGYGRLDRHHQPRVRAHLHAWARPAARSSARTARRPSRSPSCTASAAATRTTRSSARACAACTR